MFVLSVLPQTRVTSVVPAMGGRAGGAVITVYGSYFAPRTAVGDECVPNVTVTIGGAVCSKPRLISDTALSCIVPPGLGTHDVAVTVTEAGVRRAGLLRAAYVQV